MLQCGQCKGASLIQRGMYYYIHQGQLDSSLFHLMWQRARSAGLVLIVAYQRM